MWHAPLRNEEGIQEPLTAPTCAMQSHLLGARNRMLRPSRLPQSSPGPSFASRAARAQQFMKTLPMVAPLAPQVPCLARVVPRGTSSRHTPSPVAREGPWLRGGRRRIPTQLAAPAGGGMRPLSPPVQDGRGQGGGAIGLGETGFATPPPSRSLGGSFECLRVRWDAPRLRVPAVNLRCRRVERERQRALAAPGGSSDGNE